MVILQKHLDAECVWECFSALYTSQFKYGTVGIHQTFPQFSIRAMQPTSMYPATQSISNEQIVRIR